MMILILLLDAPMVYGVLRRSATLTDSSSRRIVHTCVHVDYIGLEKGQYNSVTELNVEI